MSSTDLPLYFFSGFLRVYSLGSVGVQVPESGFNSDTSIAASASIFRYPMINSSLSHSVAMESRTALGVMSLGRFGEMIFCFLGSKLIRDDVTLGCGLFSKELTIGGMPLTLCFLSSSARYRAEWRRAGTPDLVLPGMTNLLFDVITFVVPGSG